jgi:uncharacterized protein (DUF697 family)
MGAIGLLSRGVKVVRPIADAVRTVEAASLEGGEINVLAGEDGPTRRLRELLGVPHPVPSEDALTVFPATPGADLERARETLERRKRAKARALAILIGTHDERAAMERRLLDGTLEMSNIAHVASLEGEDAEEVVRTVVQALGDEAVAAGRRNPGLRPAIGREIVNGSARRAGVIGALPLGPADMPVLALLQVRLASELAALHGREFGAERAAESAAIFLAGFGWRAVARSAVGLVPAAGWAARGGIAYAGTRALGEAALARHAAGHDLIEGTPIDAVKPQLEKVLGRLRRG